MNEAEIWQTVGQRAGMEALAAAFYRQVTGDPVLAPMYPKDDMEGAQRRLALFFCFRFGADRSYLDLRGHPRLRMRHAPFAIDSQARDHWLACIARALGEMDWPLATQQSLYEFFAQVADFLRNQPELDPGAPCPFAAQRSSE